MNGRWGRARKIGFRFAFSYIALFLFPFPLHQLPLVRYVARAYDAAWKPVVVLAGHRVFHLAYDVARPDGTGSGDTLYDWIATFCQLVLALAITFVWSLAARRRTPGYPRLHGLIRIYIRYYLLFVMLGYGMSKVLRRQFSDLGAGQLARSYGESSPMGLLWTFMGHSTAYTVFAGAVEVIGGLLLATRRTTTLGAIIIAGAMTNVFLLNLSYDVPVKLFSGHLLLVSLFLLVPDARRLANVLFFGRAAAASPVSPIFPNERLELARHALNAVVVLGALAATTMDQLSYHPGPTVDGTLQGTFEVDAFTRAGEPSDAARWRRLGIAPKFGTVHFLTGPSMGYVVDQDVVHQTLTMSRDPGERWTLSFTTPDPDLLVVEGTFRDAPITVRLHRFDPSKTLLESRGFHWVNEYPLNR